MSSLDNWEIIHLFNQQYRHLNKEMNYRLQEHNLYSSQWSVIFCLNRFGPMSQTEIWKYLHTEAPTITRTVSRMEKNGWLIRKPGKDKRERVIELTEKATNEYAALRQTMDQFDHDMLASLSEQEKKQLYLLLKKMTNTGASKE
ncbi:MarR family winged helix-turn-helix transcriptional regulator [Virgibacillus halodenitrificans]|uniref:MarR family transcriptional regulator n=1 Tax=Virgibacillus halodenitrificans TaxID=1482 RepID=A0ABR7VPI1_VIRHA|nr:MarR family transcriptional regulator [Virgibacillus halodenitrificans]MBD1223816.1 MarR family transcriptional regulator [Virgibacillus halodenitrificans]MCG1026673.1 MarR family transcriptional regulator [Virgibacillus halodenitrificans]MEC2158366.1 MarR family transcriptional regulator [Virgibacillus halodenitrificans]